MRTRLLRARADAEQHGAIFQQRLSDQQRCMEGLESELAKRSAALSQAQETLDRHILFSRQQRSAAEQSACAALETVERECEELRATLVRISSSRDATETNFQAVISTLSAQACRPCVGNGVFSCWWQTSTVCASSECAPRSCMQKLWMVFHVLKDALIAAMGLSPSSCTRSRRFDRWKRSWRDVRLSVCSARSGWQRHWAR